MTERAPIASASQAPAEGPDIMPPVVSAGEPVVTSSRHGVTLTDEFAWLRDPNWQQVMRDPGVLDPAIRKHLENENAYADAVLAPIMPLQQTLIAEMRGRIKEDDSTVPAADGAFAYFIRYREGGQHPAILPRAARRRRRRTPA